MYRRLEGDPWIADNTLRTTKACLHGGLEGIFRQSYSTDDEGDFLVF